MDELDADELLSSGLSALRGLCADAEARAALSRVGAMIEALDALRTGAGLHGCAAGVAHHLRAALWSVAGGFGMTALSAARHALHLGTAALAMSAHEQPSTTDQARGLAATGALPAFPDVVAWLDARAPRHTTLPQGTRSPAAQVQRLVVALSSDADGRPERAVVIATLSEVTDTLAALWLLERPHVRQRPLAAGFFEHDWTRAVRASWAG